MNGWIKLHRKILESDIWYDVTTFRIFVYLILNAAHSETVINGVKLEKGQCLRSYRMIAEDLKYKYGNGFKKYSTRTIKKSVSKLIKDGRVQVRETGWGTLFTVVNYSNYQDFAHPEEEMVNGMGQGWETDGKQMVNNNKNVKNDKNNNININNNVRESEKRKKYKFDEKQMALAKLLFKKIKENNPNAKEPNFEAWANTFRLMMEVDKREGKEIQDVILWCQRHEFWYKNILSPEKLRKQYDRLYLEMKSESKKFGKPKPNYIRRREPIPSWFENQLEKGEDPESLKQLERELIKEIRDSTDEEWKKLCGVTLREVQEKLAKFKNSEI